MKHRVDVIVMIICHWLDQYNVNNLYLKLLAMVASWIHHVLVMYNVYWSWNNFILTSWRVQQRSTHTHTQRSALTGCAKSHPTSRQASARLIHEHVVIHVQFKEQCTIICNKLVFEIENIHGVCYINLTQRHLLAQLQHKNIKLDLELHIKKSWCP